MATGPDEGSSHRVTRLSILLLGRERSETCSVAQTILGTSTPISSLQDKILLRTADDHDWEVSVRITQPNWSAFLHGRAEWGERQSIPHEIKRHTGALVFALPLDTRFTHEDIFCVKQCLRSLEERDLRNSMVVFSKGELLGDTSIEQQIEKEGEALKWLLDMCGKRYHVLNSISSDQTQVIHLLEKMEAMRAADTTGYDMSSPHGTRQIASHGSDWIYLIIPPSLLKHIFSPSIHSTEEKTTYRLQASGAGTFCCSLTGLVFVMERPGEVLYSMDNWDTVLLASSDCYPAGVLYDVQCSDGSLQELHLPHCEIFGDDLQVVRVTSDAMLMEKPLEVTDTHVKVSVTSPSLFGLTKSCVQGVVRGQVLLLKTMTPTLEIFLLARNVPLEKVQQQSHVKDQISILTICSCILVNNREYRVHWDLSHPCDTKTFKCEYIPDIKPMMNLMPDLTRFKRNTMDLRVEDTRSRDVVCWQMLRAPGLFSNWDTECHTMENGKVINMNILLPGKDDGEKQNVAQIFTPASSGTSYSSRGRTMEITDYMKNDKWKVELFSQPFFWRECSPCSICAILLVIPVDMPFTKAERVYMEKDMEYLGKHKWKCTMVVFSKGELLGDASIKQHIENGGEALKQLLEKCDNRYHVLSSKSNDHSQILNLLEKIEAWHYMVSPDEIQIAAKTLHLIEEKLQSLSDWMQKVIPPSLSHYKFTPIIHTTTEKTTFRFQASGAGTFCCSLTDLGFVMERPGEVLYSMENWDTDLLASSSWYPAGVLYDVECSDGSLQELHLPHCEICADVDLQVAHVTSDGIEVLKPLGVTDTHVKVSVTALSLFGLIRRMIRREVHGQVLLLLRPKQNILDVFLLSLNVPPIKVQEQSQVPDDILVPTSSRCILVHEREYRVTAPDGTQLIQPERQSFERDYIPHMPPMFEVFLQTEVERLVLHVQDLDGNMVWSRTVSLEGIRSEQQTKKRVAFVDEHRSALIERVNSVNSILDQLLQGKHISQEGYDRIRSVTPSQEQMRVLYRLLNCHTLKVQFFQALKKNEPYLVSDLGWE